MGICSRLPRFDFQEGAIMRTLTESDVYDALEHGQRNIATDLMDLRPWKYVKHGVNAVGTRYWILSSEKKKDNALQRDNQLKWKRDHPRGTLYGDRQCVRVAHGRKYRPIKKILDPDGRTCLHYDWVDGTAAYSGVAIVDKDVHEKYHELVPPLYLKDGKIVLYGWTGDDEL